MDRVYKDIAQALKSSLPRNTPVVKDKAPINVIRQLLVAGANPNVEFGGKTILELACASNMEDVAKLLIDYGADVNGIGSAPNSEAPIYSVLSGLLNPRLLRLLLKNGADPNIPHKTKTSPLFEACRFLNIDIIKMLLDYDADPNIQNSHGNTCLHLLINPISELRMGIIKLLLDSGADKNIYNNVGQTPVDSVRLKFKSSKDKLYKELIELFGDTNTNTNTNNNASLGVNNTSVDTHIIPVKSLHMEDVEGMTILTIPKGTLLYNSFAVDETEPSEEVLLKLMGGILPFSTSVTIGQNTIYIRSCLDQFSQKFFYSSPVGGIALGAVTNIFNATAVFETKRDLRVAVLMTPTNYHRLSGKKHPSKFRCTKLHSKYCQCAQIDRENINSNENGFNGGGNNNSNSNYNNTNNNNNNINNSNNNNSNTNSNNTNDRYACEFAKIYDVCIDPPFLHKHSLDGHIAIAEDDSYDRQMKDFDRAFMDAPLFGKKMHALNRILFDGGLSLDNRDNTANMNQRGSIYGLPEIVLHIFDTNWYGDKEKMNITHTLDIPPESSEEDTINILSKFLIDYNNDKVESLGFQTPLRLLGVSTAKTFHNFMTGVQKPNIYYGNPRIKDIIYNFYVNHLTAFLDGDLRFFFDTRTGFLMNEKGVPNVLMEDGSIVSFADLSVRGAPAMEGATLLERSFAARKAGTFWNKSDCLVPKVAAAAAGAGAGQAGGKLANKTRNLLRRKMNLRTTRKNMKLRTPVRNAPKKANLHIMPPQIEDLYKILLEQVRASA